MQMVFYRFLLNIDYEFNLFIKKYHQVKGNKVKGISNE